MHTKVVLDKVHFLFSIFISIDNYFNSLAISQAQTLFMNINKVTRLHPLCVHQKTPPPLLHINVILEMHIEIIFRYSTVQKKKINKKKEEKKQTNKNPTIPECLPRDRFQD